MKFFTSLKFAVAALLLSVGVNAMADEITWTASEQGYANAEKITEFTLNEAVSATVSKGTGTTDPAYYNSGTSLRLYGGNTLTISSSAVITKIVFTFDSGEKTNEITVDTGDFSKDTWVGSANDVTFTIGGTSGHRRFSTITVTYGEGGETPVVVARPVITPETGTYDEPQTVTITAEEGLEVYYTLNGGEVQEYTAPFVVSETTTVEAYALNDDGVESLHATSVITIVIPVQTTGDGTVENPYTVADALAIINNGSYTSDKVYVKGIITQVGIEKNGELTDLPGNSFGNATYFIADEEGSQLTLEVFRGYGLGGEKFTAEDDIKAGDAVIVYGVLTLYNKTTPEIKSGSEIYELNGEKAEEPEPVVTVGDGSLEKPYTVAEVFALYNGKTVPTDKVWIIGNVVGYVGGTAFNESTVKFEVPEEENSNTNVLLANAVADSYELSELLPVQLPTGQVRTSFNIYTNPTILGQSVLVYGSIEKYFNVAGVKSVTDAIINGVPISINSINATAAAAKGIYTVAGQKVQNVVRGGLYIIDGKKVIVK